MQDSSLFFSIFAGDYSPQQLVEMIALHLDATYAECNTWKEFASCFLKLHSCEEDRMSTCLNGNEGVSKQSHSRRFLRMSKIFTEGTSGKAWRFRCRWWLTRHFTLTILSSEIEAGIPFKALFNALFGLMWISNEVVFLWISTLILGALSILTDIQCHLSSLHDDR